MATCFIFANYFTDTTCLSLKFNSANQIEAPLAHRNFSDIHALQKDTTTIVIAPSSQFTLHHIEFPWLGEKKARIALPYALEDRLADNVDDLHFAFDRNYYSNGQYLIAVCKKTYFAELVDTLNQHNLDFSIITLDWFALRNNEACLTENGLLINDNHSFAGVLAPELVDFYLKQIPPDLKIYGFTDSNCPLELSNVEQLNEQFPVWVAHRLLTIKPLNLSQAEFQHSNQRSSLKHWSYAAAIMSLLWILSVIVVNSIEIHQLNKQTKVVDAQIATIYHQFFPQAQQVISPKFRIEQLLKSQKNENDNALWIMLNELAQSAKKTQSTIEQFRFQNQNLIVMVLSKDFDTLEALQNDLQKANINVKQTQASSHEQQVAGTLELSL